MLEWLSDTSGDVRPNGCQISDTVRNASVLATCKDTKVGEEKIEAVLNVSSDFGIERHEYGPRSPSSDNSLGGVERYVINVGIMNQWF